MPANWSSPIPQWNLNLLNSSGRHHPPPAPASSSYSPPPTVRSEALRTPSGFFGRFTTPRLGHRPAEAPDVPPVPVQPGAGYSPHHLFEAGPGQRSDDGSFVVEDMNVPGPLFGANPMTEQRGININNNRPALQPPAPIHSSSANNAASDLPIAFSPSEINTPAIPHLQPNTSNPTSTHTNPPSRPRRHRHRHRRHRAAHHRLNSSTSTTSSTSPKPKSAFRDPEIKTKLLHTLISGLLLLLTLATFLALSPQTPVFSPPFRIVNSLLIIFFAIVFLHSLIRLQSLILAFRRRQRRRLLARKNREADAGHGSADYGRNVTGGRVQYFDDPEIGLPPPGEPIRVVLARDEEIGVNDDLVVEDEVRPTGLRAASVPEMAEGLPRTGSMGQGTPKLPPPVYGVWRGSVRADPNLLHWQRVERLGRGGGESGEESEGEAEHSRPPPSYVTQEMREQGQGRSRDHGQEHDQPGLETLPATRYVI